MGIPNTIVTDNGPQFISGRFAKLLSTWDVQHVTSAPSNPQSNGEAERAVRTMKGLMVKNVDWQATLCMYNDTLLANGYSPSQLLNNRSMNSMGIVADGRIDLKRLRDYETSQREKQAARYNHRHRARDRSPVRIQRPVVIRDPDKPPRDATVMGTSGREVVSLGTSGNLLRRNRSHVSRAESTPPLAQAERQHAPRGDWSAASGGSDWDAGKSTGEEVGNGQTICVASDRNTWG